MPALGNRQRRRGRGGLAAAAGPAARPAAASKGIRAQITPYDFKRPERVGKEQMRALQTLHEGFSRNFSAGLSAMLRSVVEVKLAGVDQLTYSEFVLGRENPTCLNLLSAEPLAGRLILEINPSILYPIIDRLLGGATSRAPGQAAADADRAAARPPDHRPVSGRSWSRREERDRIDPRGRAGGEQPAVGPDRSAE